jgi:type II secretory pathway component PulF
MSVERERTLAGVAVLATVLAWLGLALMLFYVPRLSQLWAELATPLSPAQRLLLALSRLVQHSFIAVAPALLAVTAATLWWRIHTGRRVRNTAHAR